MFTTCILVVCDCMFKVINGGICNCHTPSLEKEKEEDKTSEKEEDAEDIQEDTPDNHQRITKNRDDWFVH